jgi:hypothetical protein
VGRVGRAAHRVSALWGFEGEQMSLNLNAHLKFKLHTMDSRKMKIKQEYPTTNLKQGRLQ